MVRELLDRRFRGDDGAMDYIKGRKTLIFSPNPIPLGNCSLLRLRRLLLVFADIPVGVPMGQGMLLRLSLSR